MTEHHRILVTGANGFIGRSLCKHLVNSGFQVRGSLRNSENRYSETAIEFVTTGTIEKDLDWMPWLTDIHAVVHTAGTPDFHGPETRSAIEKMNRINVDAAIRLAQASVLSGVKRFIYLSSVKVNGLVTVDRPFFSDDEPNPVEPYGRSKLAAERALQKIASESELELVILRPGLVYGPNPRGSMLQLMRVVDRELPLPLASISNSRSLLAVQNLCDLIETTLSHPGAPGGTFLVSDGNDISTPDLIRHIAKIMKRRVRLFPVPTGIIQFLAGMIGKQAQAQALTMSQRLDTRALNERLKWTPPMNFDEALRIAVKDYLRQSR